MINYKKHFEEMKYYYNNLQDAVEDFEKNMTFENREEIYIRINELRANLSLLKVNLKDIYLPKRRGNR